MMADYGQEHIRGFGAGRCLRSQEVRIEFGFAEGTGEGEAGRGEAALPEVVRTHVR